VGQGVLGVEGRVDDARIRDLAVALDDHDTRACALAERAFLARLGASCVTPVAAHARIERDALDMWALVVSEDGQRVLRQRGTTSVQDAVSLGRRLADRLLEEGAAGVVALAPRH
jgi:hydroxymethylbilane synthase